MSPASLVFDTIEMVRLHFHSKYNIIVFVATQEKGSKEQRDFVRTKEMIKAKMKNEVGGAITHKQYGVYCEYQRSTHHF